MAKAHLKAMGDRAKDVAFDPSAGSWIERSLFGHRKLIVLLCTAVTLLLGWQALHIRLNASYENMIPTGHPYIQNYLANKNSLAQEFQGNVVRIVVENTKGSIIDPRYIEALKQINDVTFLMEGIDRQFMKSIWTPGTRWSEVTEEGFASGPVLPDEYDGSPETLEQLQRNIQRAGIVGQLVANDFRSTIILAPLLEKDTNTGEPLDYGRLSDRLEELRARFDRDGIRIHITGFAKIVGDLIQGLQQMLFFFGIAIVIASVLVYWYTRCVRSTFLVVACSLIAVVWQLGLLPLFGYALDPYSILVPFLVFAIGMSHGAQKMNGVMQDIGRGMPKLIAARQTFRRLFIAGFTALMCDAVGFGVLLIIQIRVIQDLAIMASIGVAVLTFTNLILLPILLSYTGVNAQAAERSLRSETEALAGTEKHVVWRFLDLFTRRGWAILAVSVAAVVTVGGWFESHKLQIGDLDPGAPELRADSRYNQDNAYLISHYNMSSDMLVAMVKTTPGTCASYDSLLRMDSMETALRKLPGVTATNSLAGMSRLMQTALNEGSLKWYELTPNQLTLNQMTSMVPVDLVGRNCEQTPVVVSLADHKAATLERVVSTVESFRAQDTAESKLLLAAGNAGIEAATNIVVKETSRSMLLWVYAAVILLCFITFRSWQAVVCAVLPLVVTSILGEALMVHLNIGVKVATLPVIALGVGIGVDYALYVLSIVLAALRAGMTLSTAYYQALLFTGKVVMLTGFTLAIGVATWVFSPIKFQADMGLMLAFMFLWNMLGALVLLPALAYFLLPR
ncbi:efflux RND transporter permease subunit [Azospirillum agricola]|uniref:efflux RND transporter permease subunit n=1 Tax=Azospirillum agricola TaxID=1720247 RepID=UPI000A0F2EB4|nr:MMPL family transporter [Azospirillum agricola]SMH37301.1 hypothetical protein SAMN02982994_1185 [Azospirillum lipoferum]